MKKILFKLKAFTLIELLVVISIIGILAALLLANFAGIRDRADDAKLKNNLKQVQTALRMQYNDTQTYPATKPDATSLTSYIKISATEFPAIVSYISSADTFTACINLSNVADKESGESQTRCGIASPIAGRFCVCSN